MRPLYCESAGLPRGVEDLTRRVAAEADANRSGLEIQVRFLGRGHTAGDVVVYLPKERVVITGDFLTSALSNMSDSYRNEWVASLDALDFETVLPGHGEAFTDKAKNIQGPGVPLIGVQRIYELLDAGANRR